MEQKNNTSVPVVLGKKVWRLVRVLYLILRKNMSRTKLFLDLTTKMMKRRKITAAGVFNLITSHHHNNNNNNDNNLWYPPLGEYEFSCTNSPATTNPFSALFASSHHNNNKHHRNSNQHTADDHHDVLMGVNAEVMKMIHCEIMASPDLGFGRSPVVRQLRVTDSPFPLSSSSNVDDNEEDSHVDEAAERFISRFYNDLRHQKQRAL